MSVNRRRLALVAPNLSFRIGPYLRAAAALDVELTLVSSGSAPLATLGSQDLKVTFDDLREAARTLVERLRREDGTKPVEAILASDDVAVEIASLASASLGLPHNPPGAAAMCARKDLARVAMRDAGLNCPAFVLVQSHTSVAEIARAVCFPCVVKAIGLSASRGVIRVESRAELELALARVRTIVRRAREVAFGTAPRAEPEVMVEAYIPGSEYALEGLLRDGELTPLTIFQKPEPLEGPYFEESFYICPAPLARAQEQQVVEEVASACRAFGLTEGPVHAELRLNDEGAWLIEIAARTIGGQCSQLLEIGTGVSLEQLVIENALGVDLTKYQKAYAQLRWSEGNDSQAQTFGVWMVHSPQAGILRRFEGLQEVSSIDGIESVSITARSGQLLEAIPEGADYLGFVFARGNNARDVRMALERARERLRIVVAPSLKLATNYSVAR